MDVRGGVSKITATLLFVTTPTWAHHAFAAEYDANKVVTVSGVVTEFKWTNPHAWLYVDGKDENGKPGSWGFEMGSPNGLMQRGWTKGELKKGDQITIDGFVAKDKGMTANARTVILPDGRKLFGGFQSTPGAPAK